MQDTPIIYIEGMGYCKEVTIDSYSAEGVNEPYCIYEPVCVTGSI